MQEAFTEALISKEIDAAFSVIPTLHHDSLSNYLSNSRGCGFSL